VQRAHVILSDDHGKTWRLGGITADNMGESAVAELSDGSVLMNVRSHPRLMGYRMVCRSKDGGESWSEPVPDKALVDPGCQGSLLGYSSVGDCERSRLLFCNPAASRREKLTVRLSHDEGRTWPIAKELDARPSAYSSLAALGDGTIGCLYECGHPPRRRKAPATLPTAILWGSAGEK